MMKQGETVDPTLEDSMAPVGGPSGPGPRRGRMVFQNCGSFLYSGFQVDDTSLKMSVRQGPNQPPVGTVPSTLEITVFLLCRSI